MELETLMDFEPVYTEPEEPWMQSVFEVLAPLLGERPAPRVATYFTDAAALNRAYHNPPTVILGPGEPAMAHQTNEYCVLEHVESSRRRLRRNYSALVRGLIGGDSATAFSRALSSARMHGVPDAGELMSFFVSYQRRPCL